ncbi:MAG: CHAT domain-containing protein [Planctomycetota bacterium]|nr:CHAT domain-containing protein [Planctomycetota bacterium]
MAAGRDGRPRRSDRGLDAVARLALSALLGLAALAGPAAALQDPGEESLAGRWEAWEQADRGLADQPDGLERRVDLAGELLQHLDATLVELDAPGGLEAHWGLLPRLARLASIEDSLQQRVASSGAIGRWRSAVVGAGFGTFVIGMEEGAVGALAGAGRYDEASAWIEGCIEAYAELPACAAYYRVLAADVARLQGRWDVAMAALGQADAFLATQPEEPFDPLLWAARRRSLGTWVQLEMQLGRIDRALRYSAKERALAERSAELDPSVAVDSARFRYLDLLVSTGSYQAVLDKAAPVLAAGGLSAKAEHDLRYLQAMAWTGLELRDPSREPRARAEFEQLLADTSPKQLRRGSLLLGLSRLDRAAGDLDGLAERVAALEDLLAGWGGSAAQAPPARLVAASRATAAALARLRGEDAASLERHLEGLEASFVELLSGWSVAPELTGGIGYLHDTRRRTLLGELIELAVALDQPERALDQLLVIQARGALSQSLGAEAPDLASLQAALVGDGGLLIYLPTLSDTHLFLVDREGIATFRLPGDRDLRRLVRKADLDVLAGRSSGPGLDDLGRALLPVGAVARMESWTHAYLTGAELLEQPHFALLPFGDSTLGRELGLAAAPSLPLAAHLAQGRAPVGPVGPRAFELFLGPPTAAAAPEAYRQLGSLDLGQATWDALTDGLPAAAASRHLGAEASRAALLAADLGQARVLHLFCHGIHDTTQDQPAGLVLAGTDEDDGLLRWSAIAGLQVPELIILAACGGARSPGRQGEDGVQHLGGAFLMAGARAVLLSRADLEAASTLELTADFQRYLVEGDSPMEALRRARNDYAEAHGSEVLVSSLFLLGAAHEPLFVARRPGWLRRHALLLALSGLGAGALGVAVLRRR